MIDAMTWRREAINHAIWLLDKAGPDRAERESEGVLSGLGAKVREAIAKRRAEAARA